MRGGVSTAPAPPVWSAPPVDGLAPLTGDIDADVAVVGAGFSGIVAALELAAAGRSVVILEASEPGGGASGANAGQVGPLFYGAGKPPAKAAASLGPEMADRLHRQVARSGRWLFDAIAAHDIACDLRETYLCVYRSEKSLARAAATFGQWRPYGGRWEMVGRDGLADAILSERYVGGILLADGGFLDPAKLAAGLVEAAIRAGVAVHPRSPARAAHRQADGWRLESDGGSVTARHALVATGTMAPPFWPELAQCVYPMPCGIAATEPLQDRARTLLPRGGPVADLDDKAIFAPAVTADGRLLVSFLMTGEEADLARSPAPARRRLASAFPGAPIPGFASVSAGRLGLTPDGLPRLIRRDDGLLAVTGDNGFGLTLGLVAAREAARLILGAAPESLALPLTAPKPLPAARIMPALLRNVVAPLANRLGG